jgi:ADP-glucose pyrophosphorylase
MAGLVFLPRTRRIHQEIIPPEKESGEDWYLGTADAVRQNL